MWKCLTQEQTKKILEKGIFFPHPCEHPGIRKGRAPIFSWSCRAGSVPLPHCHNYFLNQIIPEIIIPKSTFLNRKEIFGLFPCGKLSPVGFFQTWANHGIMKVGKDLQEHQFQPFTKFPLNHTPKGHIHCFLKNSKDGDFTTLSQIPSQGKDFPLEFLTFLY